VTCDTRFPFSYLQLLPIHFLSQSEIGREREILREWMEIGLTEGGIMAAQQRVAKPPLLVAQLTEEWLNHYRKLAQSCSAPFSGRGAVGSSGAAAAASLFGRRSPQSLAANAVARSGSPASCTSSPPARRSRRKPTEDNAFTSSLAVEVSRKMREGNLGGLPRQPAEAGCGQGRRNTTPLPSLASAEGGVAAGFSSDGDSDEE